jgi:selenocysteine-specific elongation factor
LYNSLVEQGEFVPVSNEVVFKRQDYDQLLEGVYAHFRDHETLTVIEFRDRYQTSRRYALAFLEHLDSLGITQRFEDVRKLKNSSQQPLTD